MKKRIMAVLLSALIFSLSLAGCGQSSGPVNRGDGDKNDKTDKKTEARVDEDESKENSSSDVLVISDVDASWGICRISDARHSNRDECKELCDAIYDEYSAQMEQLKFEEKIAEAREERGNGFWDSFWESVGGEHGLYEAIANGIVNGVSDLLGSGGAGSVSGDYDEGCKHKWKVAYYHKVGRSVTEQEKIDGYVTKEESYTNCQHLACYECSNCGSVKSYTMEIPGEYSAMGSYRCYDHFGKSEGSMVKVNSL